MDRSNPIPSSSTGGSSKPGSSGPFAYQTRLLEGISSRSNSISRSGSASKMSPLSTGSVAPSTPTVTRRWTPTHRVGSSLDAVRGKFEERIRAEVGTDVPDESMGRSEMSPGKSTTPQSSLYNHTIRNQSTDQLPPDRPRSQASEVNRTPTYLKRRTLPAPIIASPLSPNTTGISVENPDISSSPFTTTTPNRIRLPTSTPLESSSIQAVKQLSAYAIPSSTDIEQRLSTRTRRANTLDTILPNTSGSSTSSDLSSISSHSSHTSIGTAATFQRRPTSLYGQPSTPSSPNRLRSGSAYGVRDASPSQVRPLSPDKLAAFNPPSPSSAMSPKPYRSSYMSSKKASTYGDNLIVGRKLGRHLPRIASGDADEDWVEPESSDKMEEDRRDRHSTRAQRILKREGELSTPERPQAQELIIPGVTNADEVAGIPGRLRLSRDRAPSNPDSPLPSARLGRGSWADVQRHLLQAYEYLCHVGEAQQWIEGCLGEELGFGVVEMEEGLRNGVVLAKLVRVYQGDGVVRRIYEVGVP